MSSLSPLTIWLVQGGMLTTVLLATGLAVAGRCRQKSVRLRVLQWMIFASVAALLVLAIPAAYRYSLPLGVLPASLPPAAETPKPAETTTGRFTARPTPETHDALMFSNADAEPSRLSEPTQGHSRTSSAAISLDDMTPSVATPSSVPSENLTNSASGWADWIMQLVAAIYLTGSCVCMARWCVSRYRLHQLFRSSQAAPVYVREILNLVSGERSGNVRVHTSSRIVSPVTWGIFRPVIMLPQVGSDRRSNEGLRFSLAHEWAHTQSHDSLTWTLVNCLQFCLYYHPLYWRARRELLLTMDQVADAYAACHADSSIDYAEFLVQLARHRQQGSVQLALGVGDQSSMLRQRVEYLLSGDAAAILPCAKWKSWCIGLVAVLLLLFGSAIRLVPRASALAQENQKKEGQTEQPAKPASAPVDKPEQKADASLTTDAPKVEHEAQDSIRFTKDLTQKFLDGIRPGIGELLKIAATTRPDGSIVYNGFVIDKETQLPIVGATVKVHIKLSKDWSTLEVKEHKTSFIGLYSFELTAEQVKEDSLYIEVEASHPRYAGFGRAGYSHSMIRKNLTVGELPFYTLLELWAGEPIEGTLLSPSGEPVSDVEVAMYAASAKATGMLAGSFSKTTSDKQGRFRIVPPTPGDGVLWIKPNQFAPQAHRIGDRRGDWGALTLDAGTNVTGQIFDVNGKPVSDVRIEVRRNSDGEKADEYLNANAIAQGITRTSVADAQGQFTLFALPDGDYQLTIEANSESYDPPPLQHVFLSQSLKVDGAKTESLVVRAVPHVILRGMYVDSRNQPRSGHEVRVFGKLETQWFHGISSQPGPDGKFELKLPHGLRDASLDIITNEHSSLRWRMKRTDPLFRGRRVKLDVIEDDIEGFEIVRYVAPILLVQAVDADGKAVHDINPIITYTQTSNDAEEMVMYTTGSQVSFEKQGDGRYRSSQLLPDETFTVTVEKEGFETTTDTLTLKEGEQRELKFVLKPAPAKKPDQAEAEAK